MYEEIGINISMDGFRGGGGIAEHLLPSGAGAAAGFLRDGIAERSERRDAEEGGGSGQFRRGFTEHS